MLANISDAPLRTDECLPRHATKYAQTVTVSRTRRITPAMSPFSIRIFFLIRSSRMIRRKASAGHSPGAFRGTDDGRYLALLSARNLAFVEGIVIGRLHQSSSSLHNGAARLATENSQLTTVRNLCAPCANYGRRAQEPQRNFPPAAQTPLLVCQPRLPWTHASSGFITSNSRTEIPPLHNSYVIDPPLFCEYSRST